MPLSAGKIRTMVEPHSVSAGRETPSRTALVEVPTRARWQYLHPYPRALQAVRDGVLVNNQTSTPETECQSDYHTCEASCLECTADHAPRDASLLPLSR